MDKERLEAMGAEALVEELSDRLDQMGEGVSIPMWWTLTWRFWAAKPPWPPALMCTPLKRIFVPDMPTSSRPQPSR